MSCKFLSGLFLVICCYTFTSNLYAENNNIITVTASGVGKDENSALKDALKNAVNRALGVYILSETTLSDENIKEKVFANSDGLVLTHEVLDRSGGNGIAYRIQIRAKVAKKDCAEFYKKRESEKITKTEITEVLRTMDSHKDLTGSLKLIFNDFPNPFLDIQTVSKLRLADDADLNSDSVKIEYDVLITVNNVQYLQFINKLSNLLENYSLRRCDYTDVQLKEMKTYDLFRNESGIFVLTNYNLEKNYYILDTKVFKYYSLPKNIGNKLFRHLNVHYPILVIRYKDSSGNPIKTDYMKLKSELLFLRAAIKIGSSAPYTISPRIVCGGVDCCTGIKLTIKSFFKNHDKLRAINSISYEIVARDSIADMNTRRIQYMDEKNSSYLNKFDCVFDVEKPKNNKSKNHATPIGSSGESNRNQYDVSTVKHASDEYHSSNKLSREEAIKRQRKELNNLTKTYPLHKIGDYVSFYTSKRRKISGRLTEVRRNYIRVNSTQVMFTELDNRLRSKFDKHYNKRLKDIATRQIIHKYQPYFKK